MMSSGFGKVYLATDKTLNELVAIKRVRLSSDTEDIENESNMLSNCISKYIVRYYGLYRTKKELWVRPCYSN